LDLSQNILEEIEENNFNNLNYLEELNFFDNKLLEIPNSICYLEKILNIDFHNNKILKLPENIGKLSNTLSKVIIFFIIFLNIKYIILYF
jgi:Leucine-rich repeat (LRR) protein